MAAAHEKAASRTQDGAVWENVLAGPDGVSVPLGHTFGEHQEKHLLSPMIPLLGGGTVDESMRVLALNLRRKAQTEQLKVILVMGAYKSDGRTFTAGNLALALAKLGSQVVAID